MMHQLFFFPRWNQSQKHCTPGRICRGGGATKKKKRKKEKLQRLPFLSCATLPFHCNKIRWMRAVNSQFHFNSSDCSALTIRRKTKKKKRSRSSCTFSGGKSNKSVSSRKVGARCARRIQANAGGWSPSRTVPWNNGAGASVILCSGVPLT